ncbi:MAG: hypothetical protein M1816_003216 [Peltula sp. TS41687]|nr:MAG: hypothetical protein M1816_003216 [Peltula sp. TS41687]
MNSVEPSEENVSHLVEMGVVNSREEAISKLKAADNDVQRAIEMIFENPSAGPLQSEVNTVWEESHFHMDNNDQPSRDLPYRLQPNVFGAPSRPPSRANSRDIIDLTSEHASADPSKSLGYDNQQQREDEELQRAMQLSMNDLGTQETGVTGQKEVHFGPATRDYYDASQWAMTAHESTQEVVLDPEAADRKRVEGEPAFLRPSPSATYLAPLLTILHSIPLAKETLLCREQLLPDYGYDDEWWSGSPLKTSEVTSVDGSNSDAELDQIIHETQRLMAFLDMTQRSYGSVEGLARSDRVQNLWSNGVLVNYFLSFQEAAQRSRQSYSNPAIFSSTGVKLLGSTGEEVARETFNVLDLKIENESNSADSNQSLYQVMDGMIWEGHTGSEETMVYLEAIGEVFTIRMMRAEQDKTEPKIDVPAIWYPDRYLEESKEIAKEMRSKRAAVYKDLEEIDKVEAKLIRYQPAHNRPPVDPRKLLRSSIKYLEDEEKDRADKNDESKMTDGDEQQQSSRGSTVGLIKKLKGIYDNVMKKLASLEEQKDKAKESLAEISVVLARPSNDPKINPKHRYTLRGVSTEPHITYVLCTVQDEESNNSTLNQATQEVAGQGPGTQSYQWWRMSFTSGESNPVSKMKVAEEEVLKVAGEGKTTLLVYASERAIDPSNDKTLPHPLINFVRADNRAFQSELENNTRSPYHDQIQDNGAYSAEITSVSWGGHTSPALDGEVQQQPAQTGPRITSEYCDDHHSGAKDKDDAGDHDHHHQQEATNAAAAGSNMTSVAVGDDKNNKTSAREEEVTTSPSTATVSGQEEIEEEGRGDQEMEDFSSRRGGRGGSVAASDDMSE